ncbi:MAG: exosortase [Verrucomicrobia bacterium]|nr:exosortase [Verrucomicrobiota bacterium]
MAPGQTPSGAPLAEHVWRRWGLVVGVWTILWGAPLLVLAKLAFKEDLYSHALLIPVVSGYLIWTERHRCPSPNSAAWPWGVALGMLTAVWAALGSPWGGWSGDERLAFQMLAYVTGILSASALVLGRSMFAYYAFPLAFLVFLVPLPASVVHLFETALQHGSADVAEWMFVATGMPSIRDGLVFRLPGLTIEVAQECSGFRSTLVLFIVSVLAAQMFLLTGWKRALLILSIIPLGLARNAFRIWTLATLSIEVDPTIMDSALHHRGGPVFFLLSLIPLNLLLWGLYRSERSRRNSVPIPSPTAS